MNVLTAGPTVLFMMLGRGEKRTNKSNRRLLELVERVLKMQLTQRNRRLALDHSLSVTKRDASQLMTLPATARLYGAN
jgi:hypothetical protein